MHLFHRRQPQGDIRAQLNRQPDHDLTGLLRLHIGHDERNRLRVLNLDHLRHGLGIHPLQRVEPRVDAAIHGFKKTSSLFRTQGLRQNGFDVFFPVKRHLADGTGLLKILHHAQFFFLRDISGVAHEGSQFSDFLGVEALHHQRRSIFTDRSQENRRFFFTG